MSGSFICPLLGEEGEGCGGEVEGSKFFSCLNFRTWGEVSEMVTRISEVNEGGGGEKWVES